jgi:hypothetical protein
MPPQDCSKLRELILYVSEWSEGDPDFGMTKLYKALFYSDFFNYMDTGKSITGAEYKKFPYGPVPSGGPELIDQMVGDNELAIARRDHYNRERKQPKALREPNLKAFAGDEIATVHRVLSSLKGMNASDVSDLSHRFIGWKAAYDYEVIPYETALIDHKPISEDQDRWLGELVAAGR